MDPGRGPGRSFGGCSGPSCPRSLSREPNIMPRINQKCYELNDKAIASPKVILISREYYQSSYVAMWLRGYVAMWLCGYYFHLRESPLPLNIATPTPAYVYLGNRIDPPIVLCCFRSSRDTFSMVGFSMSNKTKKYPATKKCGRP